MLDGRMAAAGQPQTVESAVGRSSAARLGGLEHGPAAVAANLGEDGFGATGARTAMAHLLAVMGSALQQSPARPDADVLCFDRCGIFWTLVLLPRCLPLGRLLLPRTAVFAALVPAAAKVRLADSRAHWSLDAALVAERPAACSPANARNIDRLVTRSAVSSVAFGWAEMTARQLLMARFSAMRHEVLARSSWLVNKALQGCLAAWTMRHGIRRERAVRRLLFLGVASLGAFVDAAVKAALADLIACKHTLEPALDDLVERWPRLLLFGTRYLLHRSAAIALGLHSHAAIPAESRVASFWTGMLSAWEQVAANLITAPPILVVGLSAKLARFVLAAVAGLSWPCQTARGTRSSMTLQRTWVGTCRSRPRACLATRMGW